MATVTFTMQKVTNETIQLNYVSFDYPHSKLWVKGLVENNGVLWSDRVYNLNDPTEELGNAITNCNITIKKINSKYGLNIPVITAERLQYDVNYAHTFFVDAMKCELWHKLNYQLHGIEILERNKHKKFQGQVFIELHNKTTYDIPPESYKHFTTRKEFGYCYANYSHIGRHIYEMYNAQDTDAHDDHIIPMHQISGSSYLWFGKTTNWAYNQFRMLKIKKWFLKNNIQEIVGMPWGEPKLAIGWLPVAKLVSQLDPQTLVGCVKIIDISVSES